MRYFKNCWIGSDRFGGLRERSVDTEPLKSYRWRMATKTRSRKSVLGNQRPYSIQEAAALIGQHPRTVRSAVARGVIFGIQLTPRKLVVPRAAFDKIFGAKRAAR